jgi:hypothetical protein
MWPLSKGCTNPLALSFSKPYLPHTNAGYRGLMLRYIESLLLGLSVFPRWFVVSQNGE